MSLSPLISLVIPVYNTESYLPKCLGSAVNQSFRDIEIIVVNDGSPGNCEEICGRYPGVKYTAYGENRGLFRAREHGVRLAAGQYILNLDSDDWLPLDACARIAEKIGKASADILMHGSRRFLPKYRLGRPSLEAKAPLLEYFTKEKKNTHIFLWQLTIKKDILLRVYDDLKVMERFILSEDVLHFYCCLYYAKSWVRVPSECYCYNENNTSATRKMMTTELALKDLAFMEVLFRKLEEFRQLKNLPADIFDSLKERQFSDRLGEMKKSYEALDWDRIMPALIEIFGRRLVADAIFDVLRSPSMKIPLRRMNHLLIGAVNKVMPEGSRLFNFFQGLWWKMK